MNKILSSIFLISCTSIGGGMLALPCITVHNGLLISSINFVLCWIFMTLSAFFLLEVTLWFRKKTNILTLVNQILGYKWKCVISIIYISLLYSLISAYIFAYSKWIKKTFICLNDTSANIICISIFIFITFIILFNKIKSINILNYILSSLLFIVYIVIILKCLPYINVNSLLTLNLNNIHKLLPIIITSFGFGVIIPTLTDFLKKKKFDLSIAIFIGSIIPLFVYILWIFSILGVFPVNGENSLYILNMKNTNFDITFMYYIEKIIFSKSIFGLLILFSVISILTSVIGVTLSLNDFLLDGFQLKKSDFFILIMIIVPSVFFSIYYTECFTNILKFSGILVSLLLGLLPITMTWYGRYILKINGTFKVPGGKLLLIISYIFFSFVITNELLILYLT